MFDSEYEAFRRYCEIYPDNPTLLVDTYSVLKSGVPNAIRVFKEMLSGSAQKNCAIRIDSGDLTYLSRRARKMLDDAGLKDCRIIASNSLDEYIIRDLLQQGACLDAFGVGERLITSRSAPVLGGVYKLAAIERNGEIIPKIKISENAAKITIPHFKKVYRIYENHNGKALADYICLHSEQPDFTKPLDLFDPDYIWKRKLVTDYTAQELQVPVFIGGKRVYESPDVHTIRDYCRSQVELQWDEVKRFENPHNYYVDLSQELWDIKQKLLAEGVRGA
jgi:nicotinate phosphoribosyltransferase